MRVMQNLSVLLVSIVMSGLAATALRAQDYPSRAIHVYVGFGAGSGADVSARVIGARMAQILGQQIVVENKAGAGSSLAAEFVARQQVCQVPQPFEAPSPDERIALCASKIGQ